MKNIYKIILVIVIIAAVLITGEMYLGLREKSVGQKTPTVVKSILLDQLQASSSLSSLIHYQDSFGFSIDYPSAWRLVPGGQNGFIIFSYPASRYQDNPGRPVPQNELKIDVEIYRDATGTLDEWINSLGLDNVRRVGNLKIGEKEAEKIVFDSEMGPGSFIVYSDGNNIVTFSAYPTDSKYLEELDVIAKTFKFTK
jgi:hypothetical protein